VDEYGGAFDRLGEELASRLFDLLREVG